MFKRLFFLLRITVAWGLAVMLAVAVYASLPLIGQFEAPAILFGFATMGLVVAGAFSHLHRVRLVAGRVDNETLDNRQKRSIEIPLEAGEAFDVVEAAVRGLPACGILPRPAASAHGGTACARQKSSCQPRDHHHRAALPQRAYFYPKAPGRGRVGRPLGIPRWAP